MTKIKSKLISDFDSAVDSNSTVQANEQKRHSHSGTTDRIPRTNQDGDNFVDSNISSNGNNVSIGGEITESSAILDLQSGGNKGFLLPRMTTAQRDAIQNPANSLLIFNTETGFVSVNLGSPSVPAWVNLTLNTGLNYDPQTNQTKKDSGQLSFHQIIKKYETESTVLVDLNESNSFSLEFDNPSQPISIDLSNAVAGTPYLLSLKQQQIVQDISIKLGNTPVVWENRETPDFSQNPQFSESLVSLFYTGEKMVGSVVMNHSPTVIE